MGSNPTPGTMKSGLYRHFKGNLYRAKSVVLHSETQEELVLYKSLVYKTWWVRPVGMFEEEINKPDYVGKRFLRLPWYKQILMILKR